MNIVENFGHLLHLKPFIGVVLVTLKIAILAASYLKETRTFIVYVLLLFASISMHCFDSLASQVSLGTGFHSLENF